MTVTGPVVYGVFEIYKRTRQILVMRCPFCSKSHRHGADLVGKPIEPEFGPRYPGCEESTGRPYVVAPSRPFDELAHLDRVAIARWP